MKDHHHHHHTVPHESGGSLNRIFVLCIVLNLLFVAVEAIIGVLFNSLGLLSDAGHNLSDVFSLMLALMAFRLAKRPANNRFTYGYKKTTILISMTNAVILLVAVAAIVMESITRLRTAADVSGEAVSWTAGVGIIVNGITAWLLMKDRKKDLNVQGAYLHMVMDTLVSVGVLASGIVISLTGWLWVDTAVSLVIASIILVSTYRLLKESIFLSIDAVPSSVDTGKVRASLDAVQGLCGWHHLHIWAISTTENAATLHAVIDDFSRMEEIKGDIRLAFSRNNITHCTIEFERAGTHCHDKDCCC